MCERGQTLEQVAQRLWSLSLWRHLKLDVVLGSLLWLTLLEQGFR